MSKLFFSTKPQKRYYSYLNDGHIYNISGIKPSVISDGGGVYSCYFECEPYHKVTDTNGFKTYPLYEKVTVNGTVTYSPTTSDSFYCGNGYYYFLDDDKEKKNPQSHAGNYYTRNGKVSHSMPNSAVGLPQISYSYKDPKTNTTYTEIRYLDTLISNGAKYDNSSNNFTPIDVKQGEGSTTFGDLLLDMVKNSISIGAFGNCVNSLPEYLKGDDLTKEYKIENIGYVIPANYLVMFGRLFIEKLNEAMKNYGDTIVKKYKDSKSSVYKDLTISTNVTTAPVGTLTLTPSTTVVSASLMEEEK